MKKKRYPSDLSDGEWKHIKWLLPKAKPGGRRRTTNLREVLNAIFYLVRGGIGWDMLPTDFPKWKTVYHYFRQWRLAGGCITACVRGCAKPLGGRRNRARGSWIVKV